MHGIKFGVLAAALAMSFAVPASGSVIINSSNIGYNFSIDYVGQVGGKEASGISGLGNFTFTGLSKDLLTYNFAYSITNDSDISSRLTSFGFDVSPDISTASSTGFFASANLGNNFPEGFGKVDVCFEADKNGNCTGGNGGLTLKDDTGTGTFSLTFAKVMEAVTFDDFVTRFQSIEPRVNGSSSGIGIGSLVDAGPGGGGQPITAPEPGTWLMMLGGFGLVGFALRRRHPLEQVRQAA